MKHGAKVCAHSGWGKQPFNTQAYGHLAQLVNWPLIGGNPWGFRIFGKG